MKNDYRFKPVQEVLKKHKFIKIAFFYNVIICIVLFLLFTINNPIQTAIWGALFTFVSIIFIYLLIIYRSEYHYQIVNLRKVKSERYSFFDKQGFKISDKLDLRGEYRDFHFIVMPQIDVQHKRKNIHYDVIGTFYSMDYEGDISEREENLSGVYNIGELIFNDHFVGFTPKNFVNPDYEDVLTSFVYILQRENLQPISEQEYIDIMNSRR